MRDVFVLVPALDATGPVKGAVALVNSLAGDRNITLVALKGGPGLATPLDSRVHKIFLAPAGDWHQRLKAYKNLLDKAGGRSSTASISFCFSADMINLFCRKHAVTCASVRGNLLCNYRMDYGLPGITVAMTHLCSLRGFDHVVAMTEAMAEQVRFYSGRRPNVIGNFVDEQPLEVYRRTKQSEGPLRFVFLASLSTRKQPLLLLKAITELRRRGMDICLDMIGDGVLRSEVEVEMLRLKIGDIVTLHGYLDNPYELVAQADVMVLPSISEGLPRAALEALHLGVPCVLRAVDGNAELIRTNENGTLFETDEALPAAMIETVLWSRKRGDCITSLLPPAFRQRETARRYLNLVESKV